MALWPISAYATQNLVFDSKISPSAKHLLTKYAAENLKNSEHLSFARADLNSDGLNEFFIKTSDCAPQTQLCTFVVVAENGEKVVQLGQIAARKLMLDDGYTHGIRDIRAFNSPNNDFEYKTYSWAPLQSSYEMKDSAWQE